MDVPKLLRFAVALLAACSPPPPGPEPAPADEPAPEVELRLEPPEVTPADLARLEADQRQALSAALAAVEARPRDVVARRRLAAVLDQLLRHDEAARAWRQVVLLAPDDARAHHHAARNLSAVGRADDAIAALRRATELAPGYAPSHWRLGLELFGSGALEEADAAFAEAARLAPDDPSGLAGRARVALEAGDLAAADDLLDALVTRWPEDGYPPKLLQRLRLQQGRAGEAAALAQRGDRATDCFQRDPWTAELAEARRGRRSRMEAARGLLERGRAGEAYALLERMHAAAPDDVTTEVLLLRALVELDRTDDALAVAEASPHRDTHPRAVLARAGVHAARGEHVAMLACADRALELSPGLAAALVVRAEALQALERREEAVGALEQLLAQGPPELTTLLLRATLLAELGRLEDARAGFEAATGAFPHDLGAVAGLCEVQIHAGDLASAATTLETLRTLPASERVVAHLSDQLVRAGAGGPR